LQKLFSKHEYVKSLTQGRRLENKKSIFEIFSEGIFDDHEKIRFDVSNDTGF
jgi:hypothetical protein